MKLFQKLKSQWREARKAPLGKRFQSLHRLRKESAARRSHIARMLLIALAVALLVVATVLAVIPGPAFVFAIPGFAILAAEFLWAARFLDVCEKRTNPLTLRIKRLWDRLSRNQKIATIASATACSVALAVVALI